MQMTPHLLWLQNQIQQRSNGTFLNGKKGFVIYHIEVIKPLMQMTPPVKLLQN